MIRIPAPFSFSIYRGATFSSLMTFFEKDPDKEPLDLTLFDDIEIRFFRRSNQDDPDYIRSVSDSTLQIGGADDNELTFSFTPEEAKGLHDLRVVYSELRFFINGDIFVYQNGQARLVNVPQGAGANDFELTITKETNEITIEGLASVARAIQANEDADDIKQAIEQLVEDAENAKEAAENSASDAEKHAQETGAFEDSEGNPFDKGAKGYSEDASGSATASGESAELAEKWATEDEDTPVETDPDRFSAFHWAQKALAAAASILGLNQIRDTPEITELEDDTAIPVQRSGEDAEHILTSNARTQIVTPNAIELAQLELNPRMFFLDNFARADTATGLGTSPTGLAWSGDDIRIVDKELRLVSGNVLQVAVVDHSAIDAGHQKTIHTDVLTQFNNDLNIGCVVSYVDADNWWAVSLQRRNIVIIERWEGTTSQVASSANILFNKRIYTTLIASAGSLPDTRTVDRGISGYALGSDVHYSLPAGDKRDAFNTGKTHSGVLLEDVNHRVSKIEIYSGIP